MSQSTTLILSPPPARSAPRQRSVLPGFRLSLGFTLFWLGLIVLIPLSAVAFRTLELGWSGFFAAVTSPRVLASFRLSFGVALRIFRWQ